MVDWLEKELRNWADECRSGPWPHPLPPDRAMSLEGNYMRDSVLELEERQDIRATRRPLPDAKRAAIVQAVYNERLDSRERRILVDLYIRLPAVRPERTIRQLHITAEMYEAAMRSAALEIAKAFRTADLVGAHAIPERV